MGRAQNNIDRRNHVTKFPERSIRYTKDRRNDKCRDYSTPEVLDDTPVSKVPLPEEKKGRNIFRKRKREIITISGGPVHALNGNYKRERSGNYRHVDKDNCSKIIKKKVRSTRNKIMTIT